MNSRSSKEIQDQDIARVFDAHDIDVPAALDEKILSAARQTDAAPASTGGTRVYRRNNWYVHGFAIAASIMLTIAIVPMLVQAPDATDLAKLSESDLAEADVSARMPEQQKATRKSSEQVHEALAQTSISGGSASADPEREEMEHDAAMSVAKVITLDGIASYNPDEPETWLDAIKTLVGENEIETAREEYNKFRARYPDYQAEVSFVEILLKLGEPE